MLNNTTIVPTPEEYIHRQYSMENTPMLYLMDNLYNKQIYYISSLIYYPILVSFNPSISNGVSFNISV